MAIHLCGGCTTERCNNGQPCNTGALSYVDRVLSRHERNGYDDSDFYALVWDAATQSVKSVDYASTRGWTYHNHAIIDAPAEIVTLAAAYQRMVREAYGVPGAVAKRPTQTEGTHHARAGLRFTAAFPCHSCLPLLQHVGTVPVRCDHHAAH